jgi:hypothetical protein
LIWLLSKVLGLNLLNILMKLVFLLLSLLISKNVFIKIKFEL